MGRRLPAGLVLAVGQTLIRGSVALYTLLLVRRLSQSDFGELTYILALLGVFLVLADGGLSRLLIRDVARDGELGGPVRAIMTLRLGTLLAVAVAAAGVLLTNDRVPVLAAILLLIYLAAEATSTGFESASFGAERPKRVLVGQALAASALAVAAVIVLLADHVELTTAAGGFAAAGLVKLMWQAHAWWPALRRRDNAVPRSRALAREAAPYLVLSLLGTIYYRIDQVLLHALRGPVETASYGAAYRLVDMALVAAGLLSATVSARISRLHRDAPSLVWPEWKRLAVRVTAITAGPVVALTVLAEPLVALLFGERYAAAGDALQLLAPGILFMVLQTLNAIFLFTSDIGAARILQFSLVHVAVNVVLTYALVDEYGSSGGAAATTLSEVFAVCYFTWFVRRSFPVVAAGAG